MMFRGKVKIFYLGIMFRRKVKRYFTREYSHLLDGDILKDINKLLDIIRGNGKHREWIY